MNKDYSKYSYAEFCNAIDEDDSLELILNYEDFCIWRDKLTGRYFYIETGENDASEFCELRLVAKLTYDANNDLLVKPSKCGEIMSNLFDCDCCGEYVADDHVEYVWFKETSCINALSENADIVVERKEVQVPEEQKESDNYKKFKSILAETISVEAMEEYWLGNPDELLRQNIDDVYRKISTNKNCPKCGATLCFSDLPQYDYVCTICDENFYECEVKE